MKENWQVTRRSWQRAEFKTAKRGGRVFILGFRTISSSRPASIRTECPNEERWENRSYFSTRYPFCADSFDTDKLVDCSHGIYFSQSPVRAQAYRFDSTICTVSLIEESLIPLELQPYTGYTYTTKARAKRIWCGNTHKEALNNALEYLNEAK